MLTSELACHFRRYHRWSSVNRVHMHRWPTRHASLRRAHRQWPIVRRGSFIATQATGTITTTGTATAMAADTTAVDTTAVDTTVVVIAMDIGAEAD
jgi:hypothetical protein